MSIQTILTAIVFVLAVVAIVFGIVVKHTARETDELCDEVLFQNVLLETENNGLKAVQTCLKLEIEDLQKKLGKEVFKPHKADEYCVGCANLIAVGGVKPACALDRKCKDFEKKGE